MFLAGSCNEAQGALLNSLLSAMHCLVRQYT